MPLKNAAALVGWQEFLTESLFSLPREALSLAGMDQAAQRMAVEKQRWPVLYGHRPGCDPTQRASSGWELERSQLQECDSPKVEEILPPH